MVPCSFSHKLEAATPRLSPACGSLSPTKDMAVWQIAALAQEELEGLRGIISGRQPVRATQRPHISSARPQRPIHACACTGLDSSSPLF